MKNKDCARCRRPKHVLMKVACTCKAKCAHPFCAAKVQP